jgi:hypothetical protein
MSRACKTTKALEMNSRYSATTKRKNDNKLFNKIRKLLAINKQRNIRKMKRNPMEKPKEIYIHVDKHSINSHHGMKGETMKKEEERKKICVLCLLEIMEMMMHQ